MLIAVPKEIKNNEYRVGLTPASVRELVSHGHQVLVQTTAGIGIGQSDEHYRTAGATIVASARDCFDQAEMIIKVKEPQAEERKQLKENQLLFTYLHLAPDLPQTQDLMESGAICIAYETVTSARGGLPLLAPMSEVAGRLSVQAGAHCLEKPRGGMGKLLGGVPGVAAAKVVILGGGTVGRHAASMAIGLGADVFILDRSNTVLKQLSAQYGSILHTIFSTRETLEQHVLSADLVIGSVLIPGAAAPKLVTADMIGKMAPGSVIVDVAIDQGGCFETSRPTSHENPTFVVDDVIHYCVANMPGAVPQTATYALNNATLPYILAIADKGYQKAFSDDPHLRNGLNIYQSKITHKNVAKAHGFPYTSSEDLLGF